MIITIYDKHLPENFTREERTELMEWLLFYEVEAVFYQKYEVWPIVRKFVTSIAMVAICISIFYAVVKYLKQKRINSSIH